MRSLKLSLLLILTMLLGQQVEAQCLQQSVRIAVIPKTKQSLDAAMIEYQPLLQHLSTALNMPVELVPAPSYESVIDAIVSGGVDVAWLGPSAYLIAHQRDPRIEPFASLMISPGYFTSAGHRYQSLLLSRKDTFDQISQLKDKHVLLTDPASTSGSVVPSTEFSAQIHQPLTEFFGSVAYSGSHEKSLDALLERKVDAIFVASVRADAYIASGKITTETFRVLWHSSPIYYDPFAFRGGLCTELKEQIRSAMFNQHPQLFAFLRSQGASSVVPAAHSDYVAPSSLSSPQASE